MAESVSEWTARLRQYVAACRSSAPLPSRDQLTPTQEWHCRVVGGALQTWLRDAGPSMIEERAAMCDLLEVDPEPVVVFTSDVPGLVAAQLVVGPDHKNVVYLTEDEFKAVPPELTDPYFQWHVHVWSYFQPENDPKYIAEAFMKYPIPLGHTYWQHVEGTMWAVTAGRGGNHLWAWNGHKPTLLAEAISQWVV